MWKESFAFTRVITLTKNRGEKINNTTQCFREEQKTLLSDYCWYVINYFFENKFFNSQKNLKKWKCLDQGHNEVIRFTICCADWTKAWHGKKIVSPPLRRSEWWGAHATCIYIKLIHLNIVISEQDKSIQSSRTSNISSDNYNYPLGYIPY